MSRTSAGSMSLSIRKPPGLADGLAGGVEDVPGDGEGLPQRRVKPALGKAASSSRRRSRRAAALGALAEKHERAARASRR